MFDKTWSISQHSRLLPMLIDYWDDDGNFIFKEHVLEEILPSIDRETPEEKCVNGSQIEHLGDRATGQRPGDDSTAILSKVEKNFSIEKFDRASQKANDWLEDFENECIRFKITSPEM